MSTDHNFVNILLICIGLFQILHSVFHFFLESNLYDHEVVIETMRATHDGIFLVALDPF